MRKFDKLSYEEKLAFLTEKIGLDSYDTKRIINLVSNLLDNICYLITEKEEEYFDANYNNEDSILNIVFTELSEDNDKYQNIYDAYDDSRELEEEEKDKIEKLMEEIGENSFLNYIRDNYL